MQCAANRMCPGSHHFQFSFFCSGRYRVRVPVTAERIMHQLWNQAVLNVYLLSLILHLLNRCKLYGGLHTIFIGIHIQQVQKKVCLNSFPGQNKRYNVLYFNSKSKEKVSEPHVNLRQSSHSTLAANEITQFLGF